MLAEDIFDGFCGMPQWHSGEWKSFSFPQVPSGLEFGPPAQNLRLGHFAEHCLDALISRSQRYELLARNVQIIQDKRTIGELDFLVFDNVDQQVKHIELVTKFYLYAPSAKDIGFWIGPNRKDHWQLKTAKLRDHQFPLLYRNETQHHLKELRIDTSNIQQELCFKVMCFVPEGVEVPESDLVIGSYRSFEKI